MLELPTYILWNPVLSPVGTIQSRVTLNITPGEDDKLPRRSYAFFSQILKDIGLSAQPESWQILRYRSSYHDQGCATCWRDRWPVNWQVSILLKEVVPALPTLRSEFIGTTAFDSEIFAEDEVETNVGCMVIADFREAAQANQVRTKISRSDGLLQLAEGLLAPIPVFYRVLIGTLFVQEQIYLGEFSDDFFKTGATYMNAVEKICRKTGGITNFERRAYEWDELYDPAGLE